MSDEEKGTQEKGNPILESIKLHGAIQYDYTDEDDDTFVLTLGKFSFPKQGPTYFPIEKARSIKILKVGSLLGSPIMTGVTVVIGKTETGKTGIMSRMAKENGVMPFDFGEPYGYAETRPMKLLKYMHQHMQEDHGQKLILIDSFKYFVYSGGGGARSKGGVNVEFMQQLTDLSVAAIRAGVAIVAVINLQSDDAEVITTFREAAVSSIVGLIETRKQADAVYRMRSDTERFTGEVPVWTNRVATEEERPFDVIAFDAPEVGSGTESLMSAIRDELDRR